MESPRSSQVDGATAWQGDWDRIDQPHMYDFLPRDVRDLAISAQAAMWKERTDPSRPRQTPNAHPASEYLLSGRLRAIQDDGMLVGTLSGPPNKKTPYYRHRRSKTGRLKGSIYNNLIPTKPLHDAIVALLAEALVDTPDLRTRLTQHLHDQRSEAVHDRPDVAQLEAERDELKQQITATVRALSGAALVDAEEELKRLGDRRNAIEAILAGLRVEHKELRPVETVIEEALKVLAEDNVSKSCIVLSILRLEYINDERSACLEVAPQSAKRTWQIRRPVVKKRRFHA
jgi:hypothetical protein